MTKSMCVTATTPEYKCLIDDSDLNFVQSFGTCGDGPGQFKQPWDIDFDTQGNIYVVDLYKGQVVVFSEDGQYLHHFGQKGQGESQLSEPRGMCQWRLCVCN